MNLLYSTIEKYLWKFHNSFIEDEHVKLTYSEYLERAEKLAEEIRQACNNNVGLKCAVLCKSEMNTGIAVLACLKAGITAVPLSVHYNEKHYSRIIESCKPELLIKDEGLEVMQVEAGSWVEGQERELEDVAAIMYTSGTTGTPKGIMLTYNNLYSNLLDICEYFRINETDRILIARPMIHVAVLTGEFLTAICKGADIVFFNGGFGLHGIVKELSKGITVMCGTPTLFCHLSKVLKKNDSESLRTIVISGECMTKTAADMISDCFSQVNIYNVYGLTEASPRVICLGKPLRNVKCKVVNENGEEAKRGGEGELIVKGPNVMKGYYRDAKRTAKCIKNGWLHTGDIAVMDNEGIITIKGRKDDLIIRAGMNIYPQEIENQLKADDRIGDIVVIGRKDGIGEKLIFHVVSNRPSESDITKNEVFNICRKMLPGYQMPDDIVILDKINKNLSGKKMRR